MLAYEFQSFMCKLLFNVCMHLAVCVCVLEEGGEHLCVCINIIGVLGHVYACCSPLGSVQGPNPSPVSSPEVGGWSTVEAVGRDPPLTLRGEVSPARLRKTVLLSLPLLLMLSLSSCRSRIQPRAKQ